MNEIYNKDLYKTFALVMIGNHIFFYFLLKSYSSHEILTLRLRLLAIIICIPLLFWKFIFRNQQRLLHKYWLFSVTYCLPFFFSFMLILNKLSPIWLMNSVSALFFTLLLLNLRNFFLTVISGIISSILIYDYFFSIDNLNIVSSVDTSSLGATYIAAIIIGSLFSSNKDNIQKEKIRILNAFSGNLAHELRTPLLNIFSSTRTLENKLPLLIKGYKVSSSTQSLSTNDLKIIESLPTIINHNTRAAFSFIEILLTKIKNTKDLNKYIKILNIEEVIDKALKDYPYLDNENKLIHKTNIINFKVKGIEELLVHVIFNLMKNAIYHIKAHKKGEIQITTQIEIDYNYLYFLDTGPGIKSSLLPYIFNRFTSESIQGIGIGLSFCKDTLQELGGDITCEAKEGQYTKFILKFPKT